MRTYLHVFSLGIQTSLEYRSDLYLSLFSTVFPTILQLYIWQAIYTSPDMVYQGYTYPQIVLYSLMSGLVTKLTSCGFEYRIGEDIKSGGLNKFIVRPVNYVFYCFFEFEGAKLLPLLLFSSISVVLIGIASRLFTFMLNGSGIALCALAVIGALLLNFLIYFCIAALAFWITEIVRLFSTFAIISVVLSGGVLPLDIFGERIARIAAFLPFSYTVQFPLTILNGRFSAAQIRQGFYMQLIWIALFACAAVRLWKAGLKRYTAIGG